MEAFIIKVVGLFSLLHISFATWFVVAILGFFVFLFARASGDPKSQIDWEDLIVDSRIGKASPYKLGYLIGVIVSTWIVISFADVGKLSFDILGTYLTFLLGGAGVNLLVKRSDDNTSTATEPDPKP